MQRGPDAKRFRTALTALEDDGARRRSSAIAPRSSGSTPMSAFTNEDGAVTNKAKEIADITTGTFRLTSYKFDDLKVHIYGDVAVVTGRNTIKGVWDDIKRRHQCPYRFTDVFVKLNGRWQCVASQSSRMTER